MAKRNCSIADCLREIGPSGAKGLCPKHYQRLKRTGTTDEPAPRELAVCAIADCERLLEPPHGRGMCGLHYQRWRTHGDATFVTERPRVVGVAECTIADCTSVIQARGWCAAHWTRWSRHGSPTAQLRGEVVDGLRICPACKQLRPLHEWLDSRCRECMLSYWSEDNRRRWQAARTRAPYMCAKCSDWFVGDKKNRRYCSVTCREDDRLRQLREASSLRRARLWAIEYEPIDRMSVFVRDGWKCGICGDRIDKNTAWPNPDSPSIDHVIPVSRGGPHTYRNVQAAHLGCNVRKHARI